MVKLEAACFNLRHNVPLLLDWHVERRNIKYNTVLRLVQTERIYDMCLSNDL